MKLFPPFWHLPREPVKEGWGQVMCKLSPVRLERRQTNKCSARAFWLFFVSLKPRITLPSALNGMSTSDPRKARPDFGRCLPSIKGLQFHARLCVEMIFRIFNCSQNVAFPQPRYMYYLTTFFRSPPSDGWVCTLVRLHAPPHIPFFLAGLRFLFSKIPERNGMPFSKSSSPASPVPIYDSGLKGTREFHTWIACNRFFLLLMMTILLLIFNLLTEWRSRYFFQFIFHFCLIFDKCCFRIRLHRWLRQPHDRRMGDLADTSSASVADPRLDPMAARAAAHIQARAAFVMYRLMCKWVKPQQVMRVLRWPNKRPLLFPRSPYLVLMGQNRWPQLIRGSEVRIVRHHRWSKLPPKKIATSWLPRDGTPWSRHEGPTHLGPQRPRCRRFHLF